LKAVRRLGSRLFGPGLLGQRAAPQHRAQVQANPERERVEPQGDAAAIVHFEIDSLVPSLADFIFSPNAMLAERPFPG
jgi:hypothetical protein